MHDLTYIHKIKFIKNIIVPSMMLGCFSFVNAQELRGSIITKDGQVVAYSTMEHERVYPLKKSISPVLGFSRTTIQNGIESAADPYLKSGYSAHLTIDLELQKRIELIVDRAKTKLDADEVMVAVMQSNSGKVLTMATSKRYDPGYITKDDIPSLNPKCVTYPYESGSSMKPITLAIALENDVISTDTPLDSYAGEMDISAKMIIKDIEKIEEVKAMDSVIHSSNIATSQISWMLSAKEFREGLEKFGIGQQTGVSLPKEQPGFIKPLSLYEDRLHRANSAFGYGMHATFVQLLKAYNVFNNNGVSVNPQLISHYIKGKEKIAVSTGGRKHVISRNVTWKIRDLLNKALSRYINLSETDAGGMVSRSHIAKDGRYLYEYYDGFYGFVNPKNGGKYTVGILVINPKENLTSFSSAVELFEQTVSLLAQKGYLLSWKADR